MTTTRPSADREAVEQTIRDSIYAAAHKKAGIGLSPWMFRNDDDTAPPCPQK